MNICKLHAFMQGNQECFLRKEKCAFQTWYQQYYNRIACRIGRREKFMNKQSMTLCNLDFYGEL